MIVTTLDWQPVEVQGNIALTTVWVPPVKWSIDESFDTWSGFDWEVSKVFKFGEDVFVNGSESLFRAYNNIFAYWWTNVKWLISLLDNWDLDTSVYFWWQLSIIPTINKTITGKILLWLQSTTNIYNKKSVNRLVLLNTNWFIDETFVCGITSWEIQAVWVLASWKFIVSTTNFTTSTFNVIRLNSDWSIDNTFNNVTLNNTVNNIEERPDWKIAVLWPFTNVNWSWRNHIFVMNSDWTIDGSFSTTTWINQTFWTNLSVQTDNKMIVTGNFTTYNWTTVNRIVRLNTNWSIDWTFVTWTGFNGYSSVSHKLISDWTIVCYGNYTTYKWVSQNRICRLLTDWTLDWTFAVWTGFNNQVSIVLIDSNWRYFIWWSFTTYNSVANIGFCLKLNTDWSVYTNFKQWSWFDILVFSEKWISTTDWKVLFFPTNPLSYKAINSYNSIKNKALVLLNDKWVLNTNFPYVLWFEWTTTVNSILKQSDDKYLIFWDFSKYDWNTVYKFIRLNTNLELDSTLSIWTGFNGAVFADIQSDWKIVCTWSFTNYNWTTRNRIVRLNTDGTIDWTYTYSSWFSSFMSWLKIISWDKCFFWSIANRTYNWLNSNRIHLINNDWTINWTFMTNIWTWPNIWINTVLEHSNWNYFVWWGFTTWNAVTQSYLIRLNTDWTKNNTLNLWTGFNWAITSLVELDNWDLLVWWNFTTYNWNTVNRIVRIKTDWTFVNTYWTWFNDNVNRLVVEDKLLYVTWAFTTYDWQTANRIVRIHI